VDVTVMTPGGTSGTGASDQFTYISRPTVSSVAPNTGTTAGGTPVTITGANFTGASAVKFGSTTVSYTVTNATQISATSPAGSGMVDVTVTTPGGTSATGSGDRFTFVAPPPTVTSVSPTTGPAAGGTPVTITGTNFAGATAVKFGSATATYTVNSATQISATSPAGAGLVDVTVTTAGGTSATGASDQFTYISAPTVTAIAPTSGPAAGGTAVTITGTNFTGATAVKFGGVAAGTFSVTNATHIAATSPLGSGVVDVTVTTAGGTSASTTADRFTYLALPSVTSLTPNAGEMIGGTAVIINGSNFTAATAVTFGATPATTYVVNSATQITAISPAGSSTVDVTVTSMGGTSSTSSNDRFIYMTRVPSDQSAPAAAPNGRSTNQSPGTNSRGRVAQLNSGASDAGAAPAISVATAPQPTSGATVATTQWLTILRRIADALPVLREFLFAMIGASG
jgi:hypothetical protein